MISNDCEWASERKKERRNKQTRNSFNNYQVQVALVDGKQADLVDLRSKEREMAP